MTKAELIKIISKRAAVSDSSAKEFFDLFLQRIDSELQPGESAQFSNVGYFCSRKGKVKKEKPEAESASEEYLDLIIFSASGDINFKSPDNLVFSVPEAKSTKHNSLDSHFSLSVGKPVLPNLESTDTQYSVDNSPEEMERLLNRKIENLMVNLNKTEGSRKESEVLLVDDKTIYDDQLELELDEKAKKKNSKMESDNIIHSSEKLKSIAWGFGKDLSKKMFDDTLSEKENNKKFTVRKSQIASWDFGKRLWDSPSDSDEKEKIESEKNKKYASGQDKPSDKIKIELPQKSLKDDTTALGINMNDFTVSEEEEKIGNFERVRSISSSVSSKESIKEIKNFEKFLKDNIDSDAKAINYDEEFKKISSKAEQYRSTDKKKAPDETIVSATKKESTKAIKLNRSEALRKQRRYSRKSSAIRLMAVAAVMIITVGVLYILLKKSDSVEVIDEPKPTVERSETATYIERSYEIPVSYPYDKAENETQIIGLGSNDQGVLETKKTTEQTEPTVSTVQKHEKTTVKISGEKPSGTPTQAAYNIYQYGNVFIVQVAAFRSRSMAESKMKKYLGKGNNAFIEEANLQGTIWYRVRVGNFDTLEKAKQFRKSN